MTVRSTVLAVFGGVPDGVTSTLYEVPEGKTAIVRDYVLVSSNAQPVTAIYSLVRSGVAEVALHVRSGWTAFDPIVERERFLVLQAGDLVTVFADSGTTFVDIRGWLSGTLLDGVGPD